jgi:hypothetical protein
VIFPPKISRLVILDKVHVVENYFQQLVNQYYRLVELLEHLWELEVLFVVNSPENKPFFFQKINNKNQKDSS